MLVKHVETCCAVVLHGVPYSSLYSLPLVQGYEGHVFLSSGFVHEFCLVHALNEDQALVLMYDSVFSNIENNFW